MKNKVFITNWVNVAGIFIAVWVFGIISELTKAGNEIGNALRIGIFGGLMGIVLYGAIFWIGLLVALLILDFLFFDKPMDRKAVRVRLLIEWAIISAPFIYWFLKYSTYAFLVSVLAFFVTQLIRERKLVRLLQH